MGILAADFLIGCQHFGKSKRRERLLYCPRREKADGGSTLCVRLCPASSSGARRPPTSCPRARRDHVRCHHRARRRPPRVACISFWLPLPSATMREAANGLVTTRRVHNSRARHAKIATRGRTAPAKHVSAYSFSCFFSVERNIRLARPRNLTRPASAEKSRA